MKNQRKNDIGITLIALVITIVILLILAGITISTLKNSNLFESAKTAGEKYEIAKQEEENILNDYNNQIDMATRNLGYEKMIKANTWPIKVEQTFGDGVYGQRFTGKITAGANVAIHELLTETWQPSYKIIDAGGSYEIGTDSDPWIGYVPLMSSNSTYYHLISYNTGTPIKGLDFLTKTDMPRSNANYDIWILYTK